MTFWVGGGQENRWVGGGQTDRWRWEHAYGAFPTLPTSGGGRVETGRWKGGGKARLGGGGGGWKDRVLGLGCLTALLLPFLPCPPYSPVNNMLLLLHGFLQWHATPPWQHTMPCLRLYFTCVPFLHSACIPFCTHTLYAFAFCWIAALLPCLILYFPHRTLLLAYLSFQPPSMHMHSSCIFVPLLPIFTCLLCSSTHTPSYAFLPFIHFPFSLHYMLFCSFSFFFFFFFVISYNTISKLFPFSPFASFYSDSNISVSSLLYY